MLSGRNQKEVILNENDDCFYITVKNWDKEVFLILRNVLYLRNYQIPRSVSLVMLAKIALLSDYYDCAEAIKLLTSMWVEHHKKTTPIPPEFGCDLMLWMFIA
ncbi:hypothetical protein J3E71DRAFT_172182 [Bipolaris maydis]|nr:hypothetical protein J3E71DRAFT_172182 [Bipolaris maydis]